MESVIVRVARLSEQVEAQGQVYLSESDRERAARFRFPEDRARFILGRALLGQCLGYYLGRPRESLAFTYSAQGRPLLPGVEFSISHTHELVAVALATGTEVGIDLEHIRLRVKFPELARRIFSPEDLAAFTALAKEDQPRAFFQAWTGKEAALKARGVGIAEGMAEVSVPLWAPEGVAGIANPPGESGSWRIQALPLPDGYIGNVVWNDPAKPVDFRLVDFPFES